MTIEKEDSKKNAGKTKVAPAPLKATAEEIEQWKKDTESEIIKELRVKVNKETKVYYLSEPDDFVYAQAMGLMAEKKIVKAGEALLIACLVGGEPMPNNETDRLLYRTVCIEATKTIEYYETEIVKL